MEAACTRALEDFQQQAEWQPEAAQAADELLETILQRLCPSQAAWEQRNDCIQRINSVLRGMPDFLPDHLRYYQHGHNGSSERCLVQLMLFGSFCSGLWHKGSDLDLTITGRWRNRHGQLLDMATMLPQDLDNMLHRILRALQAAGVATSSPTQPAMVVRARVPLIAFTDSLTGVAVDISVSNHGGTFKSIFTRELCAFDSRFVSLYRLVKLWAETHGLNDPKSGTLNSWSITQMVLFNLQLCRPAILPPLWQLFYSEPHTGARPLEFESAEQAANSSSRSSSATNSSRGRSSSNPRQQGAKLAGAPYELLDVCAAQRQQLQPLYNSSSRDSSNRLLLMLADFFVRFRAVLHQWCELGQHRSVRLSTWFGGWYDGGAWRQDYIAGIEDPFDASDNTARTLGTAARNDGGADRLLAALTAACTAISRLRTADDVDALVQTLFKQSCRQVQQPGFDPIGAMLQAQQQQWQAQEQQRRQHEQQRRQHEQQRAAQLLRQALWSSPPPPPPALPAAAGPLVEPATSITTALQN